MQSDRELLEKVLYVLENRVPYNEVTKALRERLAQPEQEPVALETVYETIIQWDEGGGKRSRRELARRIVALYTTPPRREWVGLTDEEHMVLYVNADKGLHKWARAIEAKLKEKNA